MKKLVLTTTLLLTTMLSTIAFAETTLLKCEFPGQIDGQVEISEYNFTYSGPGECIRSQPPTTPSFFENSIYLSGSYCAIVIMRKNGKITVKDYHSGNKVEYDGTCVREQFKQLNVI